MEDGLLVGTMTTWPHQPWFKAGSITGDLHARLHRRRTLSPTERPGKAGIQGHSACLVLPQ